MHRAFSPAVNGTVRGGRLGRDGAYIDDASAQAIHVSNGFPGGEQQALDVQVKNLVDVLLIDRFQGAKFLHPGATKLLRIHD
jgi:hypothetical protein